MADLSPEDLDFLDARGLSRDEVERQLNLLRTPPPPSDLDRPATVGDGILAQGPNESEDWRRAGAQAIQDGRLLRFVPASGAASRMFRDLLQCMYPDPVADAHGDETPALQQYRAHITDFAFWPELEETLARAGWAPDEVHTVAGARASLRLLLAHDHEGRGLALAQRPKGLIPFHRDPGNTARTAVEEHLHEAAALNALASPPATGKQLEVKAHFTVSEEHASAFHQLVAEITSRLEAEYDTRFEIDFSSQASSTDTLATDVNGDLVRADDGRPLLRPGGHGALIYNLEKVGGDLITIKNIDNVLPKGRQQQVAEAKLTLIGLAVLTQAELHRHLRALCGEPDAAAIEAAEEFARSTLAMPQQVGLPLSSRAEALRQQLDRPVRVCGVVKNLGEPGGGPYWVRGRHGTARLQIVESSQIDTENCDQAAMMKGATHFNPVDLVCAMRDWRGRPHPLEALVEPATSFVAQKSAHGRELRALERPGLWNGAMDGWHTLFAEVPSQTFAPVKTVFDLLRPEHSFAEPQDQND